jgi:putative flippase GtrA
MDEPVSWLKTWSRARYQPVIGEDDGVVSTETYLTSADETAQAPRRRRWLPSRRLIARLGQFAVGSVVSTIVSQATLTGFYYWGHATALESSAAAFVAGAIPAFLINWHWTWSRKGRPAMLTELVPYFLITLTGGLAATGLTTLADKLINPLIEGRGGRSLVLDCAYLGSYGVFVLLKFTLLDRLMTRKQRRTVAAAA